MFVLPEGMKEPPKKPTAGGFETYPELRATGWEALTVPRKVKAASGQ